jgi:hypothetical protein
MWRPAAIAERLAVSLCVLLAWVVWTQAIPQLRIHLLGRTFPPAYAVLGLAAPLVIVTTLRRPWPFSVADTAPLLLIPFLISGGALLGYLLHRPAASLDPTWRYALLPWLIPLLTRGLTPAGTLYAWRGMMAGLLVLLGYGTYGLLTGNVGDPLEHALGYFGIQYNVSTRNADAMYLLALFFHLFRPTLAATGWKATLWVGLSGVTGAAIVLTQSRGAWLALLAGAILSVALLRRLLMRDAESRRRLLGLLLVAAFAAGVLSYGGESSASLQRRSLGVLAGDPGGSLPDRRVLTAAGLKLVAAHPLAGIGPGTFRRRIEQAGVVLNQGAANHVEIAFLQVWLDAGILGWMGFLLLWLWLLLRRPRGRRSAAAQVRQACTKGLAAALCVYLLLNVIFDNVAFWTIVGLVAAYQLHLREDR